MEFVTRSLSNTQLPPPLIHDAKHTETHRDINVKDGNAVVVCIIPDMVLQLQ